MTGRPAERQAAREEIDDGREEVMIINRTTSQSTYGIRMARKYQVAS